MDQNKEQHSMIGHNHPDTRAGGPGSAIPSDELRNGPGAVVDLREAGREIEALSQDRRREQLRADVANRFTYHQPNADQIPRYNELRNIGKELAFAIVDLSPISREQSLAITHLETAIFFANAAIARNE